MCSDTVVYHQMSGARFMITLSTISKEDIPTQSDVDRWPHLCGMHLPDIETKIGLLIACDVPAVFDPLEVTHRIDGGPYALRTSIGWMVNGPLGRHHEGPHVTSFFCKGQS